MEKQALLIVICAFFSGQAAYSEVLVNSGRSNQLIISQGNSDSQVTQLVEEGDLLRAEGSGDSILESIRLYEKALILLSDEGQEAVYILLRLGLSYDSIGEKDKALEYYEQALPIFREARDRNGEATTLNNMGLISYSVGEKDKALEYYEQALPLFVEIRDRSGEATTLNNIGILYDSIGEKDKALEYYEQALPILREVRNRSIEARTLNNIGVLYDSTGEKGKALEYYEQALPIFREVRDRNGEAATLTGIGLLYDSTGEKGKALEYYEQALPLFREIRNRSGEAVTLNNIGLLYDSTGEKGKALEYYEQALSLFREVRDRNGEATTLNNIGLVYDSIGEKNRALESYEQALPILREIRNRSGEATTLNNIGFVYDSTGEKDKALEYYEQALPILREVRNRSIEARTLNNIGLVYDSIGEKNRALESYEQALPILREIRDRGSEARALSNIGLVYDSIGEKDRALESYKQALLINKAASDREGEATTLNNIGLVYDSIGEKDRALESYKQALSIFREVRIRNGEAAALSNIGHMYDLTGEKDRALESYKQALSIFREVRDRSGEAKALGKIALSIRESSPLEALENISLAIGLIEGVRAGIGSEDLRATYFSTVQDYYQFKIDLLVQLGESEAAFETSEAARARLLAELLNEANVDIREGVPSELLKAEDALIQALQIVEQKRIALQDSNYERESIEAQNKELDEESNDLLEQLDDTITRIRRISPAYADTVQPQPLPLSQIQQEVLDADTVLLQYALGEKHSYLWIVGANNFQSYTLPGRSEIAAAAESFRSTTAFNTPASKVNRKGQELTALILPEIPEWVSGKRLVVSGDGILSELAFGALPLPNQETYTPLLVEHEVLTQPSISSVNVLRQQFANRSDLTPSVAVLADPVYRAQDSRITGEPPVQELSVSTQRNLRDLNINDIKRLKHTRQEADAILATASQIEKTEAFGFEANYDWITDPKLNNYSILHLATHGFVNPVNPQLSGLVLNLVSPDGQPKDDGFLRLHDIFNLKLNAELVVLSACQTGNGENISGEGIVGLSRGFMYAGAERVVVSLWNVEDEATADLMSSFYRYMIDEEKSPAAALRAAQIEQWEQSKVPYLWAAFTLQGEWD